MEKIEVVCIGQALVDCITRGKENYKKNVYRAESISLNVGGDALNESSILVKNGVGAKMVCGLGNDIAGNIVLNAAKERGVDVSDVVRDEKLTTPIANLMVDKSGGRISFNSPATMLTGFLPDPKVVKGAKVVSLASVFRAPFDTKESIINIVKAAKAEGAVVCMDTKIPTYRQIELEDIKEILPLVDYIFPNENEATYMVSTILRHEAEKALANQAEQLEAEKALANQAEQMGQLDKTDASNMSYMQMAEKIQSMGVKNVIVKTGKEGCTVCGQEEKFEMPARNVKAVDSTGAGDSFVAGFITGILAGDDLKMCCEKGTDCAAECVQHAGAY